MALPAQQQNMRQAAQGVTSRAPAANLNNAGTLPQNSADWQNLSRQAANSNPTTAERMRELQEAYEAGKQNYSDEVKKQDAAKRRKRMPAARRKAAVHNWAAASRSRQNLGRRNTAYVDKHIANLQQAQAEKSELMQQHEQILHEISETGEVTEAQKAILNSAAAKWSMLGEQESDATARLGLMGNAYKELASANWQRIQQYQQSIDQIMSRQGAGLFSIAATFIGNGLVVAMKHDHRQRWGHSGVGTEPNSRAEQNEIIKAVRRGLPVSAMGLQTVRPS